MQSYVNPRRQAPKIPQNLQRAYDGNIDLSDFCQKLLSQIDSKSSTLNRQVDEFQTQLHHFESQMAKYQSIKKELSSLKLTLEDKSNQLTRADQELSFKKNELKLLEKRYNEMKISYESQVEELNSQRLQCNFQKRQNEQLLAEIESRERKVKAQYTVIDERQSQISKTERQLQQQLDQHQINVLALKSSQEQLAKQKQLQKTQMTEVQLQFKALNELITYQANQQHETQKALETIKQKLLDQETEISQLLMQKQLKMKQKEEQILTREKDLEQLIQQLKSDLNKQVVEVGIQTGPNETVDRGIETSKIDLLDKYQQVSNIFKNDYQRNEVTQKKKTFNEKIHDTTWSEEVIKRLKPSVKPARDFEDQILKERNKQQIIQEIEKPNKFLQYSKQRSEQPTQTSMRASDLEPPSEIRSVRFADGGSQGSLPTQEETEEEIHGKPKDSNGLIDPEYLETAKSQMNLSRYVREVDKD